MLTTVCPFPLPNALSLILGTGLGGADGAIVVDLQHFQHFSVDPDTQIATVGVGTLLGDLHTRLYNAGGRAVAHGTCPQVGMGGHFTIGGLGPMSREWGMALDHIVEAEVVLANSSIMRASDTQYQDVLFAVKGAAAGFGIVTEFKLRTHPAPTQAVQYSFTWNFGSTAEKAQLFKNWQRVIFSENITRRFSSELVVSGLGIFLSGTFYGTRDQWHAFELESHFPPTSTAHVVTLTDWLSMISSEAEQMIQDAMGGIPASFYAKSLSFAAEEFITDDGVDAMFKHIDNAHKGTPAWFITFDLEGGAVNDVPTDATAYAHRDAIMWMQSYAINLLGPVSKTTRNFLNSLSEVIASSRPGSSYGSYPGYVDPYLQDPRSAYWGSNLPRLQRIKTEIDPKDVFHNPQSVRVTPKYH